MIYRKNQWDLSLCDRGMWITSNMSNQSEYDFSKHACYVKKVTLSLAFSCKFCEFLRNDCFWDFLRIIFETFGGLLLDLLLLNRLFVSVIKIINLTILKLTRISFLSIALYIKCLHLYVFSLNARKYGHFLCNVVLWKMLIKPDFNSM